MHVTNVSVKNSEMATVTEAVKQAVAMIIRKKAKTVQPQNIKRIEVK